MDYEQISALLNKLTIEEKLRLYEFLKELNKKREQKAVTNNAR